MNTKPPTAGQAIKLPERIQSTSIAFTNTFYAAGFGDGEGDRRLAITLALRYNSHAALVAAAEKALGQMDKCRRYLPKHGSFGEEGISDYESALTQLRAAIEGAKV